MAFDFPSAPTVGQEFVSGAAIYAWNGNGWAAKMKSVSADTAAGTSFAPAGNIAATNVQTAIQEVDAEKVAKAGDTMTGPLQVTGVTGLSSRSMWGTATLLGWTGGSAGYNWNNAANTVLNMTLTDAGALVLAAKGSTFGTPAGSAANSGVPVTDANILLYNASTVNWAGIGADPNGNVWFRTGTSGAPVPGMYLDTAQMLNLTKSPSAAAHAVRKDYADAGDAAATAVANAAQTAANNANANANNRVAKTGDIMSGDLTLYRAASPTTGVLYFGSASQQYIYYTGSGFSFTGPIAAGAFSGPSISVTGVAACNYLTTNYGGAAQWGGPATTGIYYDGWTYQIRAGGSGGIGILNAGGAAWLASFGASTIEMYLPTNINNTLYVKGYGVNYVGGDWYGWSCYNSAGGYGMGMYYISNCLYFGVTNSAGAATGAHNWNISTNSVQLFGAGGAWKPGGGSWADSSDARIKDVLGDYKNGLASILSLRPVVYQYKGNEVPHDAPGMPPAAEGEVQGRDNDVAPFRRSPHFQSAEARSTYIGLIAQECEEAFPEIISKKAGTIDGVPVTDIRNLDPGPLVFALINAVKELSAEVTTLKQQLAARRA